MPFSVHLYFRVFPVPGGATTGMHNPVRAGGRGVVLEILFRRRARFCPDTFDHAVEISVSTR